MSNPATQFKKGQSGNPKGRPKELPDIRMAKAMSRAELAILLMKYFKMPQKELAAVVNDKEMNSGDAAIAQIFRNAIDGDHTSLNFIFDRMIGKVVDKYEVTTEHNVKVENLSIHEIRHIIAQDPFMKEVADARAARSPEGIPTTGRALPVLESSGTGEPSPDAASSGAVAHDPFDPGPSREERTSPSNADPGVSGEGRSGDK